MTDPITTGAALAALLLLGALTCVVLEQTGWMAAVVRLIEGRE